MTFSLRHLRYFVAVAEYGQVSYASTKLAISQSAVTTSVKELEEIIGYALFDRTPQGMRLTDPGRTLLAHAYEILSKIDEAMHLNVVRNDVSGKLVVATTYTVIGYFLPLHLERIKRIFPNLEIQVHEVSRPVLEEGLHNFRYDTAVLLTSNTVDGQITTETFLSSIRRLWVSAEHPLLARDGVGLRDIANEKYIMLTVDEAANTSMRYWGQASYQPQVIMRTSSVEAVRSMVANGLGVTILSDMVHRPWSIEGRRLETINVQDPIPPMNIGLAWHTNREFTPAMRAFRSYFQSAYGLPSTKI